MDKSLDDLIAEQRSKGNKTKPRSSTKKEGGGRAAAPKSTRGSERSSRPRPAARRDAGRDSRRQDAAGPPPREPQYFLHDDRNRGFGGGEQQGPPRGSWKQAQQQHWQEQQQYERPRGRGRGAAAGTDPIITTADGWEEVAQDEPYNDRRGGGVQRRGGVFDRLTYSRDGGRQYAPRERQYGGRFGRARGAAAGGRGRGRGREDGGEPRSRYMDEHDHRGEEEYPAAGGRPARFQPYRVAGGVSKPSRGRGPLPAGRRWGHDLYDPTQEAAAPAADEGEGMME